MTCIQCDVFNYSYRYQQMVTFHLEPILCITHPCFFLTLLQIPTWWHPFGLRMTSVTGLDTLHMKFTIQKTLKLFLSLVSAYISGHHQVQFNGSWMLLAEWNNVPQLHGSITTVSHNITISQACH